MKIENLSKKFKDKTIFENVNVEFEQGKIYSIFGKNGVGKTTLLNILNGNLSFDEGKIENSSDTIFLESNDIPFEFMTADEFIKTTFLFKKLKFDPEEKDKLFEQLQFQPENKIIKDFSKGMKSKLYLIIAFLSKPEILLLDEPFSDIDLMSFRNISQILKSKKEKMTVIFSTHVAKISFELSDKIVYLQENGVQVFENHFENSDELETYIFEEMSKTKDLEEGQND